MNKEVVIRNYDKSDKAEVIRLIRLNTPQYFSPEEEVDFIHYLDNEIEEYFIVECESIIAGCGGINFEDPSKGIISWDIFHPEYQGKGLGSLLLNFRIKKIKEFSHIRDIYVRTSQLSYKFYEKNGFRLVEVVKDYWAEGLDMYKMVFEDNNH